MAQQGVIVPTTASSAFPGCALSCVQLLQAQTLCMPPNQAQSNQITYDSCFCQSPLLAAFASTPDAICVSECTIESDRQVLRAWFQQFCAQVASGVDPTTTTSTVPAGNPVIATSTIRITSGTVAATVTATGSASSSHGSQSWIAGHWQWVLMVIILAFGFLGLTLLAIWLKRRHHRKIAARHTVASGISQDTEKRPPRDPRQSATPDLWGPHQMMQATQGYGYSTEGIPDPQPESSKRASQKLKREEPAREVEKEILGISEISRASTPARPSMKRARPSELEQNARLIGAADRRSKSKKKRDNSHGPSDKDIGAMPKVVQTESAGPDEITSIEKT